VIKWLREKRLSLKVGNWNWRLGGALWIRQEGFFTRRVGSGGEFGGGLIRKRKDTMSVAHI